MSKIEKQVYDFSQFPLAFQERFQAMLTVVEPLASHKEAYARVLHSTPGYFSMVVFARDAERSVLYMCRDYTTERLGKYESRALSDADVDLMNLEKVVNHIDEHISGLAVRKAHEELCRQETSDVTLVKMVDVANGGDGDPESRHEITHYVAPAKSVSERDTYYTGYTGGVYMGTNYDVQPLGESPNNVRIRSQQDFIDRHKSMCAAPETVNFYELPTPVQKLFDLDADWKVPAAS